MDHKMTPRLQNVIENAAAMLGDVNGNTIGVEHVAMAILDDPRAIPTQVLARFVEPSEVRQAIQAFVDSDGYKGGNRP